ncbi:MAG: hypothetical protein KatS3mg091_848 [Patescibacteria group bacterium]|nr:MAG: hypothetical protein KatS3mg090_0981 [Patescibacteria group bacterium]GIW63736.1 MAG: hypothetical protein KatS3mg091_538 [Patescibacteria group bacterium]GIW64046.1 MAG: hypothetical protein KatS3mg091_848 [Patescibacteria group bacterium]
MNKKEVLIIAVTVFITVVFWLIYDLKFNRKSQSYEVKTTISENTNIKLDESVFDKLKKLSIKDE